MHSGLCCYILDANVIRKLNHDQLRVFTEKKLNMVTIDEVYFEVQSRKKAKDIKVESLDASAYGVMREIINKYKSVRNVVDYFENKGAADVALLAYCNCSVEPRLFEEASIIVTEDTRLRVACDDLNIRWLT